MQSNSCMHMQFGMPRTTRRSTSLRQLEACQGFNEVTQKRNQHFFCVNASTERPQSLLTLSNAVYSRPDVRLLCA